jgi:transposase-like protein
MVHQQSIQCPHCAGTDLQKNGKCTNGTQRYYCKFCKKQFRLTYRYNACKQGIKGKIIELTLNSSGVRDIGRVLSISKDTVTAVLKKNSQNKPLLLDKRRSQ